MLFRLLLMFAFGAAALLAPGFVHAQGAGPLLASPTARVMVPVSEGARIVLRGNTHPMAQARFDQGAAPSALPTGKLRLLLKRSPAQEAALRQYLGSLGDPHSPSYRKWLTPAQFGASFGIAEPDLQAVEAWLQGHGFKVEPVPASRNFVGFSGTLGQIAQAFHTSIHTYGLGGTRQYSNASDPQIPAALAPVVAGVSPLNSFYVKPLHVLGTRAQVRKTADGSVATLPGSASNVPELTAVSSSGTPYLFVTAADAATIYNAPNSLNRNHAGSTQQAGAGVNIGLVGDSDLQLADYLNYRRLFLGEADPAAPNLVVDGVDPGVIQGDVGEEALLDAQLSAGLAPQANIYFYSSAASLLQDGAVNAALRAIEDNTVAVLSVSFGLCEADLGVGGNQQIEELWRQAAAQGITVVVSSGDSGSAACDASSAETATSGLAVSGLASTPYDIAVGGTDFYTLALGSGFAQYVGAANASYGTALGYIPENPWNDSISNNPPGVGASNAVERYVDATGTAYTTVAAGGGGVSSAAACRGALTSSGGCTFPAGYPTPAFQAGLGGSGLPSGIRLLPDVALFASPFTHRAAWAFCIDSDIAGSTTPFTDCLKDTSGEFGVSGVGGTSAAAPAFAGVLATVIGSLPGTPRLGIANSVIYNLAQSSTSVFHDVTAGNISVPCTAGSLNCGSNGFLTGYDAQAGYDLATGLGSVDISALVAGWDSVKFVPTNTTLLANGGTAPLMVQHGTAVSLQATVTPSAVAGDVSVTATATGQGGAAVTEIVPLTSGSGTVTTVNDLPGGTYTLQGYYQGDITHAPSTSSTPGISVTITPEASDPFLSLAVLDLANANTYASNPITAAYGEYGFAYVQPANANALNTGVGSHGSASGIVTLLNGTAVLSTQTLNSQGLGAFPLYNLAPGTYSFSAQYSGDGSYNPSTVSTPVPLTITKGMTSLVVHTAKTGIVTANARSVTVELDTDSAGAAPTGALTLSVNGTTYGSAATANGALPDGAVAIYGTFTVPASAFKSSDNRFSAGYAGDGNYNGSTAAACTYTPSTNTAALKKGKDSYAFLFEANAGAMLCALVFLPGTLRSARRLMLLACVAAGLMGAIGCGGNTNHSSGVQLPLAQTCPP